MDYKTIRFDHRVIMDFVKSSSSVLDLGCGNGELLYVLIKEKQVHAQGIEIDDKAIFNCVEKGLNVLHGDIDSGLSEYQDKSFDYIILNQSLQQVKHFEAVFDDALRVGKKVIVGLPNFAYYKSRIQLFFGGKAPVTDSLPYTWYESPNMHFFSITDFISFCKRKNVKMEKSVFLSKNKNSVLCFENLFSDTGIFLISK